MIVKICGVTNINDAQLAVSLGADWLGFNFYSKSPRYVTAQAAADIISQLPEGVVNVGVFVNMSTKKIAELLQICPLDIVQLHGDEANEDCNSIARLGVKVMKALRIRQPQDIELIDKYDTEWILLDAFHPYEYGGTGEQFDWSWVHQVEGKKIFLAGGITPDNVPQAAAIGTYGIDLCSGVEKQPGIKDLQQMKKLFAQLR